jgi:hypothetical protein
MDNAMNAVERIDTSSTEIPQEPSWTEDEVVVPKDWPSQV